MAALEYVDVPDYAAIIFRRSFTDLALPGAIMSRSKRWLKNTDAVWNEQSKQWRFPSDAVLQFAYMGAAFSTAILNVRTPSIALIVPTV